jgi:hypothetical protein
MVEEMMRDYQPVSFTEVLTIHRVAIAQWKALRAAGIEAAVIEQFTVHRAANETWPSTAASNPPDDLLPTMPRSRTHRPRLRGRLPRCPRLQPHRRPHRRCRSRVSPLPRPRLPSRDPPSSPPPEHAMRTAAQIAASRRKAYCYDAAWNHRKHRTLQFLTEKSTTSPASFVQKKAPGEARQARRILCELRVPGAFA